MKLAILGLASLLACGCVTVENRSSGGMETEDTGAVSQDKDVTEAHLAEVDHLKELWRAADALNIQVEDRDPTEHLFFDTYELDGDHLFRGNGWWARVRPKSGEIREFSVDYHESTAEKRPKGAFATENAAFERAEWAISRLGWGDPMLVRVKTGPVDSGATGGIQSRGPILAAFGYKVNGQSNLGQGNFIEITMSGVTGDIFHVRRESGWTYLKPEVKVSSNEASEAAVRADLGPIIGYQMAYARDEDSLKVPGGETPKNFKTCVWSYQFKCEKGTAWVNAKTGTLVGIWRPDDGSGR